MVTVLGSSSVFWGILSRFCGETAERLQCNYEKITGKLLMAVDYREVLSYDNL